MIRVPLHPRIPSYPGGFAQPQLGDSPDAPECGGVGEGVAVDEGEVGWAALGDDASLRLAEQFAAAPGHGRERLPGFETRRDQALNFPRKLIGPRGTAAEVSA